jgi:hydroxymethylpyrimidine/phosphomethylpyrimidine kinase
MTPVCLTIAGSDPSGGAGIQADLKVFHQHQVYGESVITLLTVQNTCGVEAVKVLEPQFVQAQLSAVLRDIPPIAAKTGALGNAAMIEMLAEQAKNFTFPLIVDPVMISKHGASLLEQDAVYTLRQKLLPHAFLVIPNLPEASLLAEMEITNVDMMKKAAEKLAQAGAKNVLIKGGHLEGPCTDLLWCNGEVLAFESPRVQTNHTHGTGCVFSAAITARIAKGNTLHEAVARAKQFITRAINSSPQLGHGFGPTNMLVPVHKR